MKYDILLKELKRDRWTF